MAGLIIIPFSDGDGDVDFSPFLLLVKALDEDEEDEVGLSISSIGRVTETGDDEDLDDDDEKNDSRSSIGRVTEICGFVVDRGEVDDVDCGTGEVLDGDDVCCGAEKNENPLQWCSSIAAIKATSAMDR